MDIVLNFYNIDAMTLNKAVILETTKINTINSAIILFLFFCFLIGNIKINGTVYFFIGES